MTKNGKAKSTPTLPKISSRVAKRRLPATPGGFSINFCRNPLCDLFGHFPDPFDGRGKTGLSGDRGKVTGSGEDRSYRCPSCDWFNIVKSNRAVAEEYSRNRRLCRRTNGKHCQNHECENHGVAISLSPSSYSSFGKTAKGDPRYQCKSCKKTFSIGKPTRRHKSTDETGAILKCLVNKVPLSRICEIHDVSMKQIHNKVDFLYQQAVAFSHEREKRLDVCFENQNPYFSTDIQTVLVNWPVKKKRGTIPLLHMATVHKFSQFVVAATVDFDAEVSPEDLERRMELCGDFSLPRSMRRHARLWSVSEYQSSLMRSQGARFSKDDIATAGKLRLPGHGSRVRGDAFHYAHMMLVKKLVGNRFQTANYCLDDEAGLAAAVCSLNVEEIKSGRVNVAEISFKKGMTNDDRQTLAARGTAAVANAIAAESQNMALVKSDFPNLSDFQAITLILLWKNYRNLSPAERAENFAKSGVPWPFHTKSEPYKTIRLKTDLDDMGWDGLARFFSNATLHPVDAYFNLARRRVAGFERGIPTASNDQRIWHAYSYYNPEMVPKMAVILRFYYNYMLATGNKSKQTPAMRLGLAKGRIYPRDLLSYS